jgi:5-methylcytosine-specific restriction protein B
MLHDRSIFSGRSNSVVLPYSGKPFSVPPNLSIIGTMNTADRSLALLDTALRRRFDFIEMMPDPESLKDIKVKDIDLSQLLTIINQRIVALYDREHTIGHAYFIGLNNLESEDARFKELQNIFKNRVIPLLQEYFFDDWNKIRLVLGDNQKPKDFRFIVSDEITMESLFGNAGTDDLEWMESKRVFHVNDFAFSSSEAYIGIYEN